MTVEEQAFLAGLGPLAAKAPEMTLREMTEPAQRAYAKNHAEMSQRFPEPIASVIAMRATLATCLLMSSDQSQMQMRTALLVLNEFERLLVWRPDQPGNDFRIHRERGGPDKSAPGKAPVN